MVWWAVAVSLWLTIWIIVLARRKPGYSHMMHTISELGETSAPDATWVAFGVFLPVGLSLLGLGTLLATGLTVAADAEIHEQRLWWSGLAAAIGCGYTIAAVFPCDAGSPVRGSLRQDIHNLGGAIEYVGGGVAILKLGAESQPLLSLGGYIVFFTAIGLTILPQRSFRGIVQRVGEVILVLSLIYGIWGLH